MISSGVAENCKLDPGWPGCPPGCFSLGLRKLFGLRTNRSEAGGRWLLWLSFASRSCTAFSCSLKRLICSPCCWIKAFCSASTACCCWMSSSRCARCSRSTVFSARRYASSSSIVMPLLYWVWHCLASPQRTWAVTKNRGIIMNVDLDKMVQSLFQEFREANPSIPQKRFDEMRSAIAQQVDQEQEQSPKIALIGESGVGKSSTINALFNAGQEVSHTEASTQQEFAVQITLETIYGIQGLLKVYDMPGLGESLAKRAERLTTYQRVLKEVD